MSSEMIRRMAAAMEARSAVDPVDIEDIARAALEAMREPTHRMICAVLDLHDSAPRTFRVSEDWRAMIDAALLPTLPGADQ